MLSLGSYDALQLRQLNEASSQQKERRQLGGDKTIRGKKQTLTSIQPLLHALVFILLILVMSTLIAKFNEAYAARPRIFYLFFIHTGPEGRIIR